MKSKMLLKFVWLINLPALSISHNLVAEAKNVTERNVAETKMISKLIEVSKRETVLFMKLNSEILERFIQSHDLPITVYVNDLKTNIFNTKTRKIGAIILYFGCYAEYESFHGLIKDDMFSHSGHFVIIYDSGNIRDIEKMFSNFWKKYIYNVIVLVTNVVSSNLVSAFTYMPFINESCNNTEAIRINEFNKTSMTWATYVFFPDKFKQLNRCPLRFGCFKNRPSFFIKKSESGLPIVAGMVVDIVNNFSEILNFSLNFLEYEQDTTKLLKRVIANEVDLAFTLFNYANRSELLSATRTVYADKLILVVPPPFLMDAIAKVFLPFTWISWISIYLVALLACCTIITLKFTPTIFHDYVIGNNVKGSMLNICNIYLGGSQQILPRSNFPRFLLAKFLIFTIVMRSIYQGKVFDIMKRDVHTVELKTMDAFIEHRFTFYIYRSLAGILTGTKYLQRHKLIAVNETIPYIAKTMDPSFRGVVFKQLANTLHEISYARITQKNYTLRICKETLFSTTHGFYFTKNFYLKSEFDLLIQTFDAAGLIDHAIGKYVDMNLMKTSGKHPPFALTYGHVNGFFQLFYYGCAFAIVSFICEIIFDYVKHKKQTRSL